jgi:hypothetical protein
VEPSEEAKTAISRKAQSRWCERLLSANQPLPKASTENVRIYEPGTVPLLRRPWNQYFWAFASGQVLYGNEKLSIYDSWYWAAELASEDCGTCSEEQRDILRKAKFVEANGVSKHENLWPARYGKIN